MHVEVSVLAIRLRVRRGDYELEYEGDQEFFVAHVQEHLTRFASRPVEDVSGPGRDNGAAHSSGGAVGSVTNIAVRLDCKSGPDLIMAAAASLALGQNRDPFGRQELLDEMRRATAYFRRTYVNNFTSYLHRLIKDGKLNEPSSDRYSLSSSARADLTAKLRGS